jgi:hypothetical protein
MRDLPGLPELAIELGHALGADGAAMLAAGQFPVAALMFGGRLPLLIRDHGHLISLSLPRDHFWKLQTRDEWRAILLEVAQAVAADPTPASLADAALALATVAGPPSFPGTPVPSEAWLEKGVGLFQTERGVRVVVWVGEQPRERAFGDGELVPWVQQQLVEQAAARAEEEAEKQRRAALPVPAVATVLAALRGGRYFGVGGGRYRETWFMDGEQLRKEIFDEGVTDVVDADVAELTATIARHPDVFR